jgi:hypothetical protein
MSSSQRHSMKAKKLEGDNQALADLDKVVLVVVRQ